MESSWTPLLVARALPAAVDARLPRLWSAGGLLLRGGEEIEAEMGEGLIRQGMTPAHDDSVTRRRLT